MTDEDDLVRFDYITAQGFEFIHQLLDGVVFGIRLNLRIARTTLVVENDASLLGKEVESILETQARVTRSAVDEDDRWGTFVRAEFAVVQVIAVDVGRRCTVHAGAGLGQDAVVDMICGCCIQRD